MAKNNWADDDKNYETDDKYEEGRIMNETTELVSTEEKIDIPEEKGFVEARTETRRPLHDRYDRYDRNSSYCKDPTVASAMREMEADDRFHKLLKTIFYIVNLAGFDLCGRVTVVDRRTGKVFN